MQGEPTARVEPNPQKEESALLPVVQKLPRPVMVEKTETSIVLSLRGGQVEAQRRIHCLLLSIALVLQAC